MTFSRPDPLSSLADANLINVKTVRATAKLGNPTKIDVTCTICRNDLRRHSNTDMWPLKMYN